MGQRAGTRAGKCIGGARPRVFRAHGCRVGAAGPPTLVGRMTQSIQIQSDFSHRDLWLRSTVRRTRATTGHAHAPGHCRLLRHRLDRAPPPGRAARVVKGRSPARRTQRQLAVNIWGRPGCDRRRAGRHCWASVVLECTCLSPPAAGILGRPFSRLPVVPAADAGGLSASFTRRRSKPQAEIFVSSSASSRSTYPRPQTVSM